MDAEKAANGAEQRHLAAMNALQRRLEEDRAVHLGGLQAELDGRAKRQAAEHELALARLRDEHDAARRALEAELEAARIDALAKLEQKLEERLADARTKHAAEMAQRVRA